MNLSFEPLKHYRTQSEYMRNPNPKSFEPKSEAPTMTKPNEALSIEEMFRKFSKGEPVSATRREPIYNENANLDSPDLEKLKDADLYDKQEFSERLGAEMLEMEKQLHTQEEEQKAAKQKADDEAFEKKMDELQTRRQKQEKAPKGPKSEPPE